MEQLEDVLRKVENLSEDKSGLQKLYESSEWYSARYLAAKSLGISDMDLTLHFINWIEALRKEIFVGSPDYTREERDLRIVHALDDADKFYKIAQTRQMRARLSNLLNIHTEVFLSQELLRGGKLSDYELREVYSSKNASREARKLAGEKLDIYWFRIWCHELFM